jgi:hypothetical protein
MPEPAPGPGERPGCQAAETYPTLATAARLAPDLLARSVVILPTVSSVLMIPGSSSVGRTARTRGYFWDDQETIPTVTSSRAAGTCF